MTKEALKLALEAFGEIDWSNNSQWQSARAKVAIAALKEALAQPEQEPVQVSPLEFVEMVMEKEHLIGNPIFWAEWPNKEKNT